MNKVIKLTSHVGRDLLSSAGQFKREDAVIWEYVVNSLQYVDPGVIPNVQITIQPRNKKLQIVDNGRGMNVDDLGRFFTMHGENIDRLRGRVGRGKFGTGKSAAFGISNRLYITTVQNGRRNAVELTREMIDGSTGEDIPLKWIEEDVPTDSPNGTLVEVSDINLERMNMQPVCEYIERHLGAFRQSSAHVAVNDHVCEYREPEFLREVQFNPSSIHPKLGDAILTIRVAKAPLDASSQGIAVTAGEGNLVAIEDGGLSGKEFGNYLYGDIDVPTLETYESKIEPYDSSRSLQLNPQHPLASAVLAFIGSKLDEVRKELVKNSRDAQKTEEARRLARETTKIAEILNSDYEQHHNQLQKIRASLPKTGRQPAAGGEARDVGADSNAWTLGLQERGEFKKNIVGSRLHDGTRETPGKVDSIPPGLTPSESGPETIDPIGGKGNSRKSPSGGFDVRSENLGADMDRSRYDPTRLAILINLDHPAVKNALGSGVESPIFRRLAYEIAFSEYSMAVGYELIERDPQMDAADLLYEVRNTLNRVSRVAARLYT